MRVHRNGKNNLLIFHIIFMLKGIFGAMFGHRCHWPFICHQFVIQKTVCLTNLQFNLLFLGHYLLDGGYMNNLPADVMRNFGARTGQKNIS
jgi:hypothetical protein